MVDYPSLTMSQEIEMTCVRRTCLVMKASPVSLSIPIIVLGHTTGMAEQMAKLKQSNKCFPLIENSGKMQAVYSREEHKGDICILRQFARNTGNNQ